MHLESLSLANFRNYDRIEVELSSQFNLIQGQNAQGKTNFLEAVYLTCLGRSFRAAKNQELVKQHKQFFKLDGLIRQDIQIDKAVVIHYVRDGRKEIAIDRKRLAAHSKLLGLFPVVIMAPDEFKVTAGNPADRRRFLDILLSQVSISYLADLQEYHRTLKQRNRVLQNIREGLSSAESELEPWTENLVNVGSRLLDFREHFTESFNPKLDAAYKSITQLDHELSMFIDSTVPYNSGRDWVESFHQAIEDKARKERIFGTSMVGPHRDDIAFRINGMDVRRYGSRGEHKSVLMSLKICEFNYLYEKKEEKPVLLLDDCYSELDNAREHGVFRSLQGLGQIFMTNPRQDLRSDLFAGAEDDFARFLVKGGQIERL